MLALLQRVSRAEVRVDGQAVGAIGGGYVALIAVERGDSARDVEYIARKIRDLRLWPDAEGRMNRPLAAAGGAVLAISQFTLLGDTRRGLRPSFDAATPPEEARPLYQAVVDQLRADGVEVATGVFQAEMQVELINEGPVTVILNSRGN
ncbi:MAG: D-aminoacyl-tRNA deacylase [Terriglobales bacterium]